MNYLNSFSARTALNLLDADGGGWPEPVPTQSAKSRCVTVAEGLVDLIQAGAEVSPWKDDTAGTFMGIILSRRFGHGHPRRHGKNDSVKRRGSSKRGMNAGKKTNRGKPAIAREKLRRILVFGWPPIGAGP
jgi:hypothetical protein